ncbi:uncharacterized protein [Diabrotica undecimpunctata]|uniref:uncharacterized protein n=1 Tax=Diabrotica undecimpunctata TaxID=50387 RepID=UPI003B6385F7
MGIETQDGPKKTKSSKKNKQRKGIVSFEHEVISKDRATEVLSKIESDSYKEKVGSDKKEPQTNVNKIKKQKTKHTNSKESTFESKDISQDRSIESLKNKDKVKGKVDDSVQDDSKQVIAVSKASKKNKSGVNNEISDTSQDKTVKSLKKKDKTKVQIDDTVQDDSKQLNSISKASKKKKKGMNNEINDVNLDPDKISKKKKKVNSEDVKDQEDPTNASENPTENTAESKRAKKRKKHMELQVAKKLKATLVTQESVLNYLSKWKHSRSEWKFEKLKQIWLSQNLFDSAKIPEEFWTTTLEYYTNSRGFVRNLILRDALKLIENDKADEDNPDEENQSKLKRARDIVQTLQE